MNITKRNQPFLAPGHDEAATCATMLTRTKAQRLTDALLADRNRADNARHNIVPCWSCGHT
jgi:hypothetical protein